MNSTIQALMYGILKNGEKIEQEKLCYMLSFLADLSNISEESDFKDVGLNSTTLFIEHSLELLKEAKYDDWIDYYRKKLITNENYELVTYLKL